MQKTTQHQLAINYIKWLFDKRDMRDPRCDPDFIQCMVIMGFTRKALTRFFKSIQ